MSSCPLDRRDLPNRTTSYKTRIIQVECHHAHWTAGTCPTEQPLIRHVSYSRMSSCPLDRRDLPNRTTSYKTRIIQVECHHAHWTVGTCPTEQPLIRHVSYSRMSSCPQDRRDLPNRTTSYKTRIIQVECHHAHWTAGTCPTEQPLIRHVSYK